jgi:ribonucleotide reductase alpha subunit
MKDKFDVFSNKFAQDIFLQKYSLDGQETWADTCRRVVSNVCGQLLPKEEQEEIYNIMFDRKFIPGGRYLYSAGKPFHQVNNCFLFRLEDSREGWADAMQKATAALMTGGGIGFEYSNLRPEGAAIKRTGGTSTGPIAAMNMVNELGRYIMQGGSRRSAIWAGLNWAHDDILKFLNLKNHSEILKIAKEQDFMFPLPMELTNISVVYDTEFFIAIEDRKHPKHKQAKEVWEKNCLQAFSTAEPGFGFNFRKDAESLRNACVTRDTEILTRDGYSRIDSLVDNEVEVWNGFEWSNVTPKVTGTNQELVTVSLSDGRTLTCTKYHTFHIAKGYTGESFEVKAKDLEAGMKLIKHELPVIEHGPELKNAYTQGFVSADGMDGYNLVQVYEPKYICLERLKENTKSTQKENNGRKVITFKEPLLPKSFIPHNYNLKSKLDWLAGLFDGDGTELKEGGLQLASVDKSFLKGLQKLLTTVGVQSKILLANKAGYRSMPDGHGGYKDFLCQESYRICIGATQMQTLKKLGLKCERMSFDKAPQRDASQFVSVVDVTESGVAEKVYCFNEPKRHLGVFDGILTGQCTEVVSEDDSDKCNLGTVWINRIADKEDLRKVVKYSTQFLICGGIYSDVPTEKIKQVGNKNNRIGLGLGGIHEWLMIHGEDYEVTPELHSWLSIYEQESDSSAYITARQLGVSIPKGVRAIAPTGTIGIIAETTTGIEPLFCKAYKRRYLKDNKWVYQYVVDGSVKRLMEQGVSVDKIKDSFDLSFKQRVKFQADVQNYVDMAISSTCNLPKWGTEGNDEATLKENSKVLLKYAKRLRGFTCYPDGCRGGQPLTRVTLEEAMKNEGVIFEETESTCLNGVCGV